MKKNVYLTVLVIITVLCVIGGTCYHVLDWGVSFIGNLIPFLETEEKKDPGPVQESGEVKLDDFTAIDADVSVMNLDIVVSDHYSISCSANRRLVPEYEVKGETLVIKQGTKGMKWWGNKKCDVTITVPETGQFTKIRLDASVGDIDLKGISGSELEIDTSVGDIMVDGCAFQTVTLDASTGDVDFKDTAFDKMEIDTSVGDVDVSSPADLSGYDVELDTSTGEVTVNGVSHKRDYSHDGTERGKELTIDSSIGDIELNY